MQAIGQSATEVGTSTDSKYRQIVRQKIVHLLAIWALVYVGVEVTIGGEAIASVLLIWEIEPGITGWTVTYIIRQRGGGPSSGYVSAGFFGGMSSQLYLSLVFIF